MNTFLVEVLFSYSEVFSEIIENSFEFDDTDSNEQKKRGKNMFTCLVIFLHSKGNHAAEGIKGWKHQGYEGRGRYRDTNTSK